MAPWPIACVGRKVKLRGNYFALMDGNAVFRKRKAYEISGIDER